MGRPADDSSSLEVPQRRNRRDNPWHGKIAMPDVCIEEEFMAEIGMRLLHFAVIPIGCPAYFQRLRYKSTSKEAYLSVFH